MENDGNILINTYVHPMSSTAFPISGKTPNSEKRRYIDIEVTSEFFGWGINEN